MSEGQLQTLSMVPLKKLANEDMLYGPVAFLAGRASDGITGQTILADGDGPLWENHSKYKKIRG